MTRPRSAALLAALAAVPACTTAPSPTPDTADGGNALQRFVAADNGLEMRRWLVSLDAAPLAEPLDELGTAYAEDETLAAALDRNGLALVSIDADDLVALRDRAGELMTDMTVWHGQAPQWRPAQRAAIGRGDLAVLVDGRVRVYRGGAFNLLLRSWTLPMEDGARLQLELVPQHEPPTAQGLRRLVAADELVGEPFRSLLVELQMTPGRAWVLTSLRGGASARPPDGSGSAAGGGTGPSIGPDVEPPPTIGELLFVDRTSRLRTVLVFLAALPPGAAPPDAAFDGAASDAPLAPLPAPLDDDGEWDRVPVAEDSP